MKITRIERARPRYKDDEEKAPLWLVGFTDLISLMLAFFILLFATTSIRNPNWIEATKSMRSRFGGDMDTTFAPFAGASSQEDASWTPVHDDPGLDIEYLYSVIRRQIASDPVLRPVRVTRAGNDMVLLSMPMQASFSSGVAVLSDNGRAIMERLSPLLNQFPNAVEVVGHADPSLVDDSGAFGSNWHLSLARAQAVAAALRRAGYDRKPMVRGRGGTDLDLLPKNLPETVRNEWARRVDIRLRFGGM